MSIMQKIAVGAFVFTVLLLGVFPQSPFVAFGTLVTGLLVGAVQFMERERADRIADLEKQIKRLDERLNILMIGRGLGK